MSQEKITPQVESASEKNFNKLKSVGFWNQLAKILLSLKANELCLWLCPRFPLLSTHALNGDLPSGDGRWQCAYSDNSHPRVSTSQDSCGSRSPVRRIAEVSPIAPSYPGDTVTARQSLRHPIANTSAPPQGRASIWPLCYWHNHFCTSPPKIYIARAKNGI